MATMERFRWIFLVAFLVMASSWRASAQAQKSDSQQNTIATIGHAFTLSPEAAQVADEIGVAQLLDQLATQRAAGSSVSLESLAIRQEITEKVLAASLQVDSVNAVIDSEIEQIRAIRSDLQSRRDKAQNIINLASIVTGGALGVVNTALQFNSSTANFGNGIGVGGGSASVIVSIVGIRQQSGGRRVLGDSPRMLARFFGRLPGVAESIRGDYPEEIWSYVNSATPSQPNMTRREQLIAKWRGEGRINQDGSPKGERKIESLSGNLSETRKLNIDDLSNRIAMLLDVRATVSLIKREISEILRGLTNPS